MPAQPNGGRQSLPPMRHPLTPSRPDNFQRHVVIKNAPNASSSPAPRRRTTPAVSIRVCPLFPEIEPHLQAMFDAAEPGEVYLFGESRRRAVNLRTQFQRIIKRAGVAPWPKLFQNLRASRATELADAFPSHVAAAWLGHTEAIANAHYRQVTDDHFASAVKVSNTSKHPDERVSGNPTRNPTQHIAETRCNDKNMIINQNENRPEFPSDSSQCISLHDRVMAPPGLEPGTLGL